jgi:hypothetical protein
MMDRLQRFKQPATVDEAVEVLISDLTTQQMAALAGMNDVQFDLLCEQLVPYLQHDFRLWTGNDRLLISCFETVRYNTSTDPMRIIMDRVRSQLRSSSGVLISDALV